MGYLLTAVPPQFEGESFLQFRDSLEASKRLPQERAAAFQADEWRVYLEHNAASLPVGYEDIAASLRKLITDHAKLANGHADLEALEQRLDALETEMLATARARQSADDALESSRRWTVSCAISRQDDRRSALHARKAVPGASSAGKGRTAAIEFVPYALKCFSHTSSPGAETAQERRSFRDVEALRL